ncbi:hypothetical protein AGR9A_Lc60058 [Agrobacterium salinitolerans str. Hayward 0363]|nr:hypothetical protein AGR9A_Lc60058 [Agrobacterium salinitolerans str. Hayward 0363]
MPVLPCSAYSLIDRCGKKIVPTNGKVRYVSLLLLSAAASYAASCSHRSIKLGQEKAVGLPQRNSLPNWRLDTQQSASVTGNCGAPISQRPL